MKEVHNTRIGWLAISLLGSRAVAGQSSTLHQFEAIFSNIKRDFQFLQPDRRKLLERLKYSGWGVFPFQITLQKLLIAESYFTKRSI
jgi:hypothetical protein